MSYADDVFIGMCKDIFRTGSSTEREEVRPVWPDTGEKAHTIKKFGVVNRYDLRKEFPAITLRPTPIKSAFQEILWIYQKKSSNIKDLGLHIWDEWADTTGSIGKAYGYQIGQEYYHHKDEDGNLILLDQMDAVIYDLKHTPFSRRIMTNIYNFADLFAMNLYPCCYSTTWNVTDEGYEKPVLNMIMNQRSHDTLTAGNWNVVQYALLLMCVAQCVDMIPGEFVHVIADAHIYDRHVPIVEQLIKRKTYDAPRVTLDPDIKDFYEFTPDSVSISDYQAGPQVKNIPVAV